jgi:hypothetical protein
MMRRKTYAIWFLLLWFAVCGSPLKANIIYPLEIFTSDGQNYELDLNLYVVVSSLEQHHIDFTFYNESSIDSSIAWIYFDDNGDSLMHIDEIENGPGTKFSEAYLGPGNLPGGDTIDFSADFSIGAEQAIPHNGVNPPDEWVTITFDLIGGSTLETVTNAINDGSLRIGVLVIAFPDGSSGSAIAVPEPGTLILLGTAGLWIFTRKRQSV